MIIRVLGQGQFELDDARVDDLNTVDDHLEAAVAADDQEALSAALAELGDLVRTHGTPVEGEDYIESDLILPGPDASLAEVHAMLGDSEDGLVPG